MSEYRKNWINKRGTSNSEYEEYLAKRKGTTKSKIHKESREKRRNEPQNKRLSQLITSRLKELGKTKTEFVNELGIPCSTFNSYSIGTSYPNESMLEKILSNLGIDKSEL